MGYRTTIGLDGSWRLQQRRMQSTLPNNRVERLRFVRSRLVRGRGLRRSPGAVMRHPKCLVVNSAK
jgi:hypothetical protein